MMQLLRMIFFYTTIALVLSGCVYKIDIQQGNIITDQDVQNIHPGMTVAAVKKMLGTPLTHNLYKTNQLYYVYTMKRGRHPRHERQLIVYFTNGRVSHITTRSSTNQ